MSKVKNLMVLGVGYVLGAQAGRGRYEQLKQQATRIAEHPRTQQLARTAREQAATRLPASVTSRFTPTTTRDAVVDPTTARDAAVDPTTARDAAVDPTSGIEVENSTRPSHL